MPQIFKRQSNGLARAAILCFFLFLLMSAWGIHVGYWSSFTTRQGMYIDQPVPFSHEHHVSGLGIDCRYCHTSAETASFAGIPPTDTCMTCHSQIWTDAPMLEPVRQSMARNQPLTWNRVHDLPDFVYFDHSIHIAKGVGCITCHGQIDRMPLIRQEQSLYMKWCINCHRNPEPQLRPTNEIFNFKWAPGGSSNNASQFVRLNQVHTERLTDCSTCHR